MSDLDQNRRAFATTMLGGAASAALLGASWPLLSAMMPSAAARARRDVVSLDALREAATYIQVRHRSLLVLRRTEGQLEQLRLFSQSRPDSAGSWHRSVQPHTFIAVAGCTRDACVVRLVGGEGDAHLLCPSCGARFDLAGRRFSGPAPRDLDVPKYRYIDDTHVEIEVS